MTDPINRPFTSEDTIYTDAPPMKAAGKGDHNREARIQAAERAHERERNALASVLSTDEGQAVILRILDHCRPYQSTISSEPSQAGFAEGRRSVGLWLISALGSIDAEVYPNLLLAHVKRQRQLHGHDAGVAAANPHPSL